MPSIIIRPIHNGTETLISSRDSSEFWVMVAKYVNETMAEYVNTSDEAPRHGHMFQKSALANCLETFDARNAISLTETNEDYAISHLGTNITENATNIDNEGLFCPVIFDSWTCWNATLPDDYQVEPCPDFVDWGWTPTKGHAFKYCTEKGEWWSPPNQTKSYSHYHKCNDEQEIAFINNINAISLSGYCISTCVLLLSLFIFFYFRALNCGRIKMHKNFFTSLTLNNICWILWYSDIISTTSNGTNSSLDENPLVCRLLHIIQTYFMLSTYFWMLCEGAYLHLLLKYTWGVKQWQMWCLVTAGWTLPAVSIIPYTYCRTEKNTCGIAEPISKETESNCWRDYEGYTEFLAFPVVAVMVSNIAILISVIVTITRKRMIRQSEDSAVVGGPNSMESSMKAARAALMLVPILGVHFVLLPMRPDSGSALEDIYLIASAIASSYQGFFVSVIFCFLNSEVIDTLRRRLRRNRRNHRNFDATVTTRTDTVSKNGKQGNMISMKYLSRKDNKATRDESMECLQAQLRLENLKSKGGDTNDGNHMVSKH